MGFKQRLKAIGEAKAVLNEIESTGLVTQAEIMRKLKGKKTLAGFTYVKSQNTFKKTNCTVSMTTLDSYSYSDGYKLTFVKDGKLFLNTHAYSMTTTRHVSSVRELFRELGIKFDYEIELTRGDEDFTYYDQIESLGEHREEWLDKADLARTQETKARYLKQAERYTSMLKVMQKFYPTDRDIKNALAYVSTAKADRKRELEATKEARKLELQAKRDLQADVQNMVSYRKNLAKNNVPLATGRYDSITDNQAFGM